MISIILLAVGLVCVLLGIRLLSGARFYRKEIKEIDYDYIGGAQWETYWQLATIAGIFSIVFLLGGIGVWLLAILSL